MRQPVHSQTYSFEQEQPIKTLSILGSGWLGLPLARHFATRSCHVKASTTSKSRLPLLTAANIEPYILDIRALPGNIQTFLHADVLIVNIPSKDKNAFSNLLKEIEQSAIKKVVFVSSTSVYEDTNTKVAESDGLESSRSPLFVIENLFRNCSAIETTIVRFGGLIGYSRHPGRFFRTGRPVHNPEAHINLIHRDDCIGIISQIIEQQVWGEIFNCCADTHPTKREFYTHAAKLIGMPAPKFVDSDDKSYKIISNQKVKEVLNYTFQHPDLMKIQFEDTR